MANYLKKSNAKQADTSRQTEEKVANILEDIKLRQDEAVEKYSLQFDNWTPASYQLSEDQIRNAEKSLPVTLKEDITFVAEQIRHFAHKQLETMSEIEVETHPGITLGHKLIPIQSIGNYVPGGRYPLISSALMSTIPARVAGVKRISSFTPPNKNAEAGISPEMIFALNHAGADNIYALGGVQAIGSMAYGTQTIQNVDMITGPGNAYVAEAKRQLYGKVGIDLPAGPSEILIIADSSADPDIVTADLIAQAEHDPYVKSILITTSQHLAEQVLTLIPQQLDELVTSDVARPAWDNYGEIIVADNNQEAVELSDRYASEHVEVQTRDNDWFLDHLHNYGSLFLGEASTVVHSDVAIGTNHILPTMGAAKHTSGVWVGKFIKTQTYQRLTKEGSHFISPLASRQALAENLIGHSIAADKRSEKYR